MNRTVHTIWLGDKYPKWALYNVNRFLHLNPGWVHTGWLNPKQHDFLQNSPVYNEYVRLIVPHLEKFTNQRRNYFYKIHESNILRMLILREYGGFYMDTDVFWLQDIEPFVNEHHIWGIKNFTFMYISEDWQGWQDFFDQWLSVIPLYIDILKNNEEEPTVVRAHTYFWSYFFRNISTIHAYEEMCVHGVDDSVFKNYIIHGVLETNKMCIHNYRHGI